MLSRVARRSALPPIGRISALSYLPRRSSIASTTITKNKGLKMVEPLIFEQDQGEGVCAYDVPRYEPYAGSPSLGEAERDEEKDIGLPGLSEPAVMRHYVRLSDMNYSVDHAMYPLGSCTMKYNPRLNEEVASMDGFAHSHPLQPVKLSQGILKALHELGEWLIGITGMDSVDLTPGAGSHGEYSGIVTIKKALVDQFGEDVTKEKGVILVPESAHGTNPATAAMAGFRIQSVKGLKNGRIDLEDFKKKLGPHVAGTMMTNPNTCGVFEHDAVKIAKLIHDVDGYFYMDGANLNALMGYCRPGDLGVDAMHINVHKTFSTPHGGGGPGAGPVVFSRKLTPYRPIPRIEKDIEGKYQLIEHDPTGKSVGRIKGFHGQVGILLRALAYCKALGMDGLRLSTEVAVLNANYLLAKLRPYMSLGYDNETCMHEVLFDDKFLSGTGVKTMDIAKALLDEGFHPPTVYFPLVVTGALLIEPTESETKQSLDRFANVLIKLAEMAKDKEYADEFFHEKPVHTPTRRLDDTVAASCPVLKWTPRIDSETEKQKAESKLFNGAKTH